MSCMSLSMTVSSLVGLELAPEPGLATLPLGLHYLASMMATLPASQTMRRYGRRAGFSIGALLGFFAGIFSALGIFWGSFEVFCAGAFLLGSFNGHAVFYRFAAADTATPMERSRAISLVLRPRPNADRRLRRYARVFLHERLGDSHESLFFTGRSHPGRAWASSGHRWTVPLRAPSRLSGVHRYVHL